MDIFQKQDFARPDSVRGIEVDADAEGRKRSGAGFLHGEGALPVYPGRLPLKPFADKFVVPECS